MKSDNEEPEPDSADIDRDRNVGPDTDSHGGFAPNTGTESGAPGAGGDAPAPVLGAGDDDAPTHQ